MPCLPVLANFMCRVFFRVFVRRDPQPFVLDGSALVALEGLEATSRRGEKTFQTAAGIVNVITTVHWAGREVHVTETTSPALAMVMVAYASADDFAAAVALMDCAYHGEPVWILEERLRGKPVGLRVAWVAGGCAEEAMVQLVRERCIQDGRERGETCVPLPKEDLLKRALPVLARIAP